MKTKHNSASVLARLLNLAKERGDDYNLVLNRFALERLLSRLSKSRHANQFLLKGALLFTLWYQHPHRPTRDADLLGFGDINADDLAAIFKDVVTMNLEDGIVFDATSVRVDSIREDNAYGGLRVRLTARIGSARCALQIDVGFGDAVTPKAQSVTYPTLLPDFDSPRLKAYPIYTVIAEKYHAMVVLNLANTRMKDFYDLSVIATRSELEGALLAQAITATFARRQTALPTEPPLALRSDFAAEPIKLQQWQAFLAKNRLQVTDFGEVIGLLYTLLWPATQVAVMGSKANARWDPERRDWVMV